MSLHLFGLIGRKCLLATNPFMSPPLQGLLTGFLAFKDVFAGGTRPLFFSKPQSSNLKFLHQFCSEQAGHKASCEQICFSSHFSTKQKSIFRYNVQVKAEFLLVSDVWDLEGDDGDFLFAVVAQKSVPS